MNRPSIRIHSYALATVMCDVNTVHYSVMSMMFGGLNCNESERFSDKSKGELI